MYDDIILGAGWFGLVLANTLRDAGHQVTVLEASDRPGGLIRSARVQGCVVERGPQALLVTPSVARLLASLNLSDAVLQASPAAKHRYALHQGALLALPHGPVDALRHPIFGPSRLLRILAEPLLGRRLPEPASVHDLLASRLGPGLADALSELLVTGIFAGDPRALDADAAFPEMAAWARGVGLLRGGLRAARQPRPPGPRGSVTMAGGLESLVVALAERLGSALHRHHPVERIEPDGTGWITHSEAGTTHGRRLWLACPLPVAARLLGAPELTVPTAPMAAIAVGWKKGRVEPLDGFGWLAPKRERTDAVGCLWPSQIFPDNHPGFDMARLLVGGARAPELPAQSPDALAAHAQRVLREVHGIDASPDFIDVTRISPGIPQYPVGYARTVRDWQQRWPNLRLFGWGTAGIGLSQAATTAEAWLRDAAISPR